MAHTDIKDLLLLKPKPLKLQEGDIVTMITPRKEDEGSVLDLNLIQKQVNDDTPKALDTHTLLTLILSNYNRYFKCKALIDDTLAYIYEVPLKQILNCKKRIADRDPFEPDRISLRPRLVHLLKKLELENKIEKYGPKVWRILE